MNRVQSLFTVRNCLFAVVGLLATALAGVTGWEAWSVRAEQQAAEQARAARDIAALTNKAAYHWAEERSAVQMALLLEEPADDALNETIATHRKQADALFEQAKERLAQVPEIQVQGTLSKASLAYDNAEFMRGLAAEDAALPRGERDETLPQAWHDTMTELVVATRAAEQAILAQAGSASAEIQQLTALNHDVWLVDEYVRRQAAIIGPAVATEGLMGSETVAELASLGGHVDQAWQSLELYMGNVQADPAISQALADLDAAYGDAFAPVRDKSVTAGSFGSTYPVDTREWFAIRSDVGEAVTAVDAAIGETADALTAEAAARGELRFTIAAALFVVAVGAGLASVALVARRVVAPIGHITDVLTRLTAGEDDMDVRYTARSDEIGGMARAVEELRAAVGKAFRLQQMVEEMPISVLTCDADDGLRMDYVNAESRRILGPLGEHLAVPIEEAVGQPIDVYTIFHRDAGEQHRLLADPENLPLRKKIGVGQEWLDVRADPIYGRDGSYVGPMITWNVITERMKLAEKFEANIQSVVETVSSAANEMQATASSMSGTAEETTRQAGAVSAASEQASSSVQTVASAAEEMSASVKEVGSQASRSTEVAQTAVQQAEDTNRTVGGLNEAASKIGEVVSLITDIAEQTNLLALNATIEAARAGEAGKGFAVVADEVKALATQTANATEEIAKQISAMQGETQNAVDAIGGIGKTIAAIDDAAGAIAAAVEEQAASIEEIARNAQQAAQGTDDVSSNIGGVTQAAGETGAAAQQVLSAAEQMSSESETLRREVSAFLEEVRAA